MFFDIYESHMFNYSNLLRYGIYIGSGGFQTKTERKEKKHYSRGLSRKNC